MSNVGIVVVSHSAKIAEGVADMIRQVVGDSVAVAPVGGTADGALGTDPVRIKAGIESVFSPKGVVVLVDLGGAEMNSEVAIEALPPADRALVLVCDAPIVEGSLMAATEASAGADLSQVLCVAERTGEG